MPILETDYLLTVRGVNSIYKEEITEVAAYITGRSLSTDAGQVAVIGSDGGVLVASTVEVKADISTAILAATQGIASV